MYDTYEEAEQALRTAELDVIGDMGEEALEVGYSDIVRAIASECLPEVGQELIRRNL